MPSELTLGGKYGHMVYAKVSLPRSVEEVLEPISSTREKTKTRVFFPPLSFLGHDNEERSAFLFCKSLQFAWRYRIPSYDFPFKVSILGWEHGWGAKTERRWITGSCEWILVDVNKFRYQLSSFYWKWTLGLRFN